jgi:hypothetical protein
MKKIESLQPFLNTLPYSSELFGVYQPLLGWKSKRIQERWRKPAKHHEGRLIDDLVRYFDGVTQVDFNADCFATLNVVRPGTFAGPKRLNQHYMLLRELSKTLPDRSLPADEWRSALKPDILLRILEQTTFPVFHQEALTFCRGINGLEQGDHESNIAFAERKSALIAANQAGVKDAFARESAVAGLLLQLADAGRADVLNKLFFGGLSFDSKTAFLEAIQPQEEVFQDPYLTFDPKKDIDNVSLSPLGIVHLFRQFFFEFDTFLGSPTGHVWLAPGASVELIEISTRRTLVEKTYETALERTTKSETSRTDKEEISEAVKQDNKDDLKLGITTTVNQSWGTGSASATASLNMDRTQQVARETSHKRTREQTEKLSSEIRENFKSTFKTVTETTDTQSKRIVIANSTDDLINYELRRKMRQVGVQVQDIGSFLCWETFVDEPGAQLGLGNLVHIAKPADLIPVPVITDTPMPPDKPHAFTTGAVWDFGDNRKHNYPGIGFVPLTTYQVPPPPDGYEIRTADFRDGYIEIRYVSHSGEDSQNQIYAFRGKFTPDWQQITIGVVTGPDGIEWDERIDFVVGGAITYTPTAASVAAIKAANDQRKAAATAVESENTKKQNLEYLNAAKERIEVASRVEKRKFEALREEERIIVYRNLIQDLMTGAQYKNISDAARHVMSELINSIFDVDKMLYFVAPEWWKPRTRSTQFFGVNQMNALTGDHLVNWSDNVFREDNYLITDKSAAAAMGSSLGWLLQLDGDDHRNAFLNAPWVKAVIPIRPGREKAAINWLQNVNVEGADGLDAAYAASAAELAEIRAKLLAADPADPVSGHPKVTLGDAIRFLCTQVSQKHQQSNRPELYPKGAEIHDDDKVSATPIDKVYEFGFYPLKGGFRYDPDQGDPDDPDNRNFHVFDQWIEILPTDQVVPVPVVYDPKTGRQK